MDTHHNIISITKKLLAGGNMNPSMNEIAKEAGITKAAIYYFFEDKQDLFDQAIQSIPTAICKFFETTEKEKILSIEKIKKIVNFTLECRRKESGISQILFQQAFSRDEKFLTNIFQKRQKAVIILSKIIKEGISEGSIRPIDPEKTAQVFMGFLDFLAMAMSLPCSKEKKKSNFIPEDLCVHLVEMIEHKNS